MATSDCAIHETAEEVPETAYRVCFECGHVYPTAEDLEKAYEERVAELKKRDNEGGFLMPLKKADEIFFCQFCLHDF